MDAHQQRRSGTFMGVVTVLTTGPHKQSAELVVKNCEALEALDKRLLEIASRMNLFRGPTSRAGQTEAWKQEIRQQLLTLKEGAAAHRVVPSENGKLRKLVVAHFTANPEVVERSAREIMEALEPARENLVANGYRAALEAVPDAIDQMHKWQAGGPDERQTLSALVAESNKLITQGRKLIKSLRHHLARQLREDDTFRAAFNSAARIPERIGAKKNSRYAQEMIDEAQGIVRRKRRPPARPIRFEDRPPAP